MGIYEFRKTILEKQLAGAKGRAERRRVKLKKEADLLRIRKEIKKTRGIYRGRKGAGINYVGIGKGVGSVAKTGFNFMAKLGENLDKNTKANKKIRKRYKKNSIF